MSPTVNTIGRMSEPHEEPVHYEVENVPVEEVRVGDSLQLDTDQGQLIALIEFIQLVSMKDREGRTAPHYEFTSALVEGEMEIPEKLLKTVFFREAGSVVTRIVARVEP